MSERRKQPVHERFAKHVKVMESGCHEWQSVISKFGYGKFWFRKKQDRAHRVAWVLFKGEIPEGQLVLHHCDNRRCVNVDHLYLGSHKDNVRDCIDRGRRWGRRKLTDAQALEIRQVLTRRPYLSQAEVGAAFGVSQQTVSKIMRRTHDYVRRLERK